MTKTETPLMVRRIRLHEVGEEGREVEVAEERGIGGIFIRPFYGQRTLGIRPMTFATLSTCAYLIEIPTRARQLQQ